MEKISTPVKVASYYICHSGRIDPQRSRIDPASRRPDSGPDSGLSGIFLSEGLPTSGSDGKGLEAYIGTMSE